MGTFPYPYMNGRLHLGHSFSLTKLEFAASYQRMLGKRVLLPFGFHCTGMPIKAASDKLKRELELYGGPAGFPERVQVVETEEEKAKAAAKAAEAAAANAGGPKAHHAKKTKNAAKTIAGGKEAVKWSRPLFQWEIMRSNGLSDEDIPAFADPDHWLKYFPPLGKTDLDRFGLGVDWRRSFITTDRNPYYDSFVRWQLNTLKELGKVQFGKRAAIYSPTDAAPCADHDRASGEGVGVQDYTLIKLRVLELPAQLKHLEGKNVFLVCATLRPETMYGQTNCWVKPDGAYGAFEINDTDVFVCCERSARNMAYQGFSKEDGVHVEVGKITGQELIGTPCSGPLSSAKRMYVLPLPKVSLAKGTGVVTSVPSDAPDDYMGIADLKKKEFLREKYGVKDEWVMDIEMIEILETPELGRNAAEKVCLDLKVASANDTEKLNQAKEITYKAGFYQGVMIVGPYAGKTVQEVKKIITAELIESGDAIPYSEPEKEVTSRSGDVCVVAYCDQWYVTYGEDEWREQTEACLEQMETYSEETRDSFKYFLGWLKQWACSRKFGLGTRLPWDEQWLIESLSDSTFYMAYYTVAHFLQGGRLDGQEVGPAGIKASDLTDAHWDYIFLGKDFPADSAVPEASFGPLKAEFNYWYPLDLRVSGRDLIGNHLTFWMYTHVALLPKEMWPKAVRTNGHLMRNNEKMAKSTGNFLTVNDGCEQYSATAIRLGLANAGDFMVDANFEDDVVDTSILRLTALADFVERFVAHQKGDTTAFKDNSSFRPSGCEMTLPDRMFETSMNETIAKVRAAYDGALYREAVTQGFFTFSGQRELYRVYQPDMNLDLVQKAIETQLLMLTPIIPAYTDYIWRHVLGKSETIVTAPFPVAGEVDSTVALISQYIDHTARDFRLKLKNRQTPKKGKEAPPLPTRASVLAPREYPEWAKIVAQVLDAAYDEATGEIDTAAMKSLKSNPGIPKSDMKDAMAFAGQLKASLPEQGRDVLKLVMPFDEQDILNQMSSFLASTLAVETISIFSAVDEIPESDADLAKKEDMARPYKPFIVFF